MALLDAVFGPIANLLDRIIPDPRLRDEAKLALLKLQGDQELVAIDKQMQAIVAEAQATDPWNSRARPSFLYVMYALVLWSIPMGMIAAADPKVAAAIGTGMTTHLRGIPDELYTLFGTVERQSGRAAATANLGPCRQGNYRD